MDIAPSHLDTLVAAHVEQDRSPRARVRRVIAWILQDPARPLGVERLAEHAAMSPRSLSRLFRRETGTTPARFVAQVRVQLARRLLELSGLHVGSVALRAGFDNPERMRRTFRRALGVSPRGYASLWLGNDS
jgi:transcriptional regulator GlxA family with amidase domain